jgi:Phage P22-like portal protein
MSDVQEIGGDPILLEAKRRFKQCVDWESWARIRYQEDVKFANADTDNGYQWPHQLLTDRQLNKKPILTINKVRQHNLNIVNDLRENMPRIKFRAMGNGATVESARIWDGIAKHIEAHSKAENHYIRAITTQVDGGIGYLRVHTEYKDEDTFDQEIYIKSLPDPLLCYLDPDAREPDKSDARFGFIFEDMPKDEFDRKYPAYKDKSGIWSNITGDTNWIMKDHIRVAEYFAVEETKGTLLFIPDWQGKPLVIPEDAFKAIAKGDKKLLAKAADPLTRRRDILTKRVIWRLIIGNEIAETRPWPGKFIPIIPVIGEEIIIEQRMDRKGHTRAMKDSQRMYNYNASAAVEFGSLQTKTPWILPAESVEGYEEMWGVANLQNLAYLPYKAVGEDGKPLPPPQRIQPPVSLPVAVDLMKSSDADMMAVSGQFENSMGQVGNERTGAAIDSRKIQGDRATYHYVSNFAMALRHVGNILYDLVPKIYDTKRTLEILADDGQSLSVTIDPQQEQALKQTLDHEQKVIERSFNPALGQYEVEADTGPGYATRRQETLEAFTLLLTQNPQLAAVIGDLMIQSMEVPLADVAAERLRRMVPPQALGQGPSQNEQMLQQQLEQFKGLAQKLDQELKIAKQKLAGREEKRNVDIFNALTKRLQVLGDHALTAGELAQLAAQATEESRQTDIGGLSQAVQGEAYEDMQFDQPEGQQGQAPQGYMLDPRRPGRLLRIIPNDTQVP